MKIGIDISQIIYGTGVSHYTRSLIEALLKIDQQDEFVLFGSSLRSIKVIKDYLRGLRGNFVSKVAPFPPILLEILWNQAHLLPIEILTGKLNVFHSSDWLEPPAKCPKVTTIHDLTVYKYPETFSARGGHDIVANIKRKLEWVRKESDKIIAVSQATKRDIVEVLGIPEERIAVIYEAAPTYFQKVSSDEINQTKKKFGLKGNYLLSVSTLEPRKNLKRIIEAFEILRQKEKDLWLVLVGKTGWGQEIPRNPRTVITGYVTNTELSALYSGALALAYPSLYEGFGQPILEAMTCGCPVVTSDISSMPEVAGEAAVLVNPLSVESITEGIKQALANRKELVRKGFQQVKKFSWEKSARETMTVYQSLV